MHFLPQQHINTPTHTTKPSHHPPPLPLSPLPLSPGTAVFWSEPNNQIIRMMNLTTNQISIVAGQLSTSGTNYGCATGAATPAHKLSSTSPLANLGNPSSLVFAGSNTLLITSFGCSVVFKLDMATMQVTTFIGQLKARANCSALTYPMPASIAPLGGPTDVAYDPVHRRVFVADFGTNRIVQVADGIASVVAGRCTQGRADGPGTSATFNKVVGLAVDVTGNFLFVAGRHWTCAHTQTQTCTHAHAHRHT